MKQAVYIKIVNFTTISIFLLQFKKLDLERSVENRNIVIRMKT